MQFERFVHSRAFGLSEGSIYERLRRHPAIVFDPHLAHATLIYEERAAALLERLHREYLDVGQRHRLPMLALTDTWRANKERIRRSKFHDRPVNQDNVRFLTLLRESYGACASTIFIGGQIGPQGDAYTPEEAPASRPAERFHAVQVEALAEARVDCLYASTLPALSEAQGIAAAMANTHVPYVLSFVVRRDGGLLDGTPLAHAIDTIDGATSRPPVGYAVNCVHPRVFHEVLAGLERQRPSMIQRIVSCQANTSARDPKELDALGELETEPADTLAASMWTAFRRFRMSFSGGCCGTDAGHIEALARAYSAPGSGCD